MTRRFNKGYDFTLADLDAAVDLYAAGVQGLGRALTSQEAADLVPCSNYTICKRCRARGLPVRRKGRPQGGSL